MQLPLLPIPAEPDPYEVLERRALYDSPWIRLREDRFRHRRGREGQYAVCGFQRSACGVLALDDEDRVVLVGQWRYPLEQYSWELPEGGGEEHESPFETIRRELAEETNLEAGSWEPLAFFHPSNSSTDEEAFLFLATELRPSNGHHQAEDDEELAVHREPFAQCLLRVLSGEISDGLTAMAMLSLQARRSGAPAMIPLRLAERFFQRPSEHPSLGRDRWNHLPETKT
ncbi:MAG: NUDIX hydrolase [Holophagaceae bacterium]|nr:NUDIX hydrolase [Holophagaceae bacterium]